MTTPVIDLVRNNFDAAAAARQKVREIDDRANAAKREFTAPELAQIAELRSTIEECEQRIADAVKTPRGGVNLEGLLPDIGGPGSSSRAPGAPGFEARSEDVRRLFDEVRDGTTAGRLEFRAVTAYPAVTTQNVVGVVPLRREPTRVAAYMPNQPVETATASYWSTTTGATAAATVAPGAAKPESTPGWTSTTSTVRKVAHFTQVPKEALDDFPSFQSIVESEMLAGLVNTENTQLVSGDGTGTNLTGLLVASGIQTYAPGSAEARLRSILHAITMLRTGTAFLEADTVVLHPTDWEIIQTYATSTGDFLVATAVVDATARSLFGVPVVVTTGIASGTGLVGALAASTVVFQREMPSVFVDPYSASTSNLVKFICEERLALGVVRPTGLVKITFNGTA